MNSFTFVRLGLGRTLLMLTAVLAVLAVGAWAQGPWDVGVTAGAITATLSEDGTLTVSGSGRMKYFGTESFVQRDARNKITAIVIESGVTSISSYAFYDFGNLQSVTIPEGVTTIGASAFAAVGFAKLTSVTIPASVDTIGYKAFGFSTTGSGDMSSLKTVIFLGPNPPKVIEISPFSGQKNKVNLIVPKSSVDAYRDAFYDRNCACYTEIISWGFKTKFYANNSKYDNTIIDSVETGLTEPISSLPTATRLGYDLEGWYTARTAGVKVTPSTVFDSDTTLYARWTPKTYNITYELNGGTVATPNPTSYTVSDGGMSYFRLNAPTKAGTTFTGWTGSNGDTPQKSVSVIIDSAYIIMDPLGDKHYIANWASAPTTYTITYDLAGGTVSSANPATYTSETNTFTLNNPTKSGATFKGWTGSNGTTPQTTVRIEKGSTGDKSYTANWSTVSVLSQERVVPQSNPSTAVSVAPVSVLSGEFSVGPNPVSRSSGAVSFFRTGGRVSYSTLSVYDASGNLVKKIRVIDDAVGSQAIRKVGTWNLRDASGRAVSEGTYVVRGVLKTKGGKSEKVSAVVGVR